MSLKPPSVRQYHVFLASPGDGQEERRYVRRFIDEYNRYTAHIWNAWFEVVDWENYSTIGVGRPQELITRQTLEKYRDLLALVIGIMGQRFGSPSGRRIGCDRNTSTSRCARCWRSSTTTSECGRCVPCASSSS